MKRSNILVLVALAVLTFACSDAARPPTAVKDTSNTNGQFAKAPIQDDHSDEENAPRISLADAKKDFDNKTAVFIDTHMRTQFDAEHIPGAINIQANMIKFEFDKVPKGKKIIAYCS